MKDLGAAERVDASAIEESCAKKRGGNKKVVAQKPETQNLRDIV